MSSTIERVTALEGRQERMVMTIRRQQEIIRSNGEDIANLRQQVVLAAQNQEALVTQVNTVGSEVARIREDLTRTQLSHGDAMIEVEEVAGAD